MFIYPVRLKRLTSSGVLCQIANWDLPLLTECGSLWLAGQ
jgi:hypothetical protein